MSTLETVLNISEEELHEEIKTEYTEVALDPQKGYHFHTGRAAATRLGYDEALFANLPEGSIDSFAGVGNPFLAGPIHPGETVVDAGSGAGFDALIAASMVGEEGHVIGVDMTPEMLKKARAGAQAMGLTHVEFREGLIEDLPLADNFADLVISNGVLNLTIDKVKTLREWARVLKPGGRLQIGDILLTRPVPQSGLDDISLWTGWIAGGLLEAELLNAVSAAGFENAEIVQKHDIFKDVPDPSSSLKYGAHGISLSAHKPK